MFRFNNLLLTLILFILFSPFTISADLEQNVDLFEFHSVEVQQRATSLAKTLRCPQCQNQNLVESNAQAAKDLRLKVYTMANEGSSDQEIKGLSSCSLWEYCSVSTTIKLFHGAVVDLSCAIFDLFCLIFDPNGEA